MYTHSHPSVIQMSCKEKLYIEEILLPFILLADVLLHECAMDLLLHASFLF